MTVLAACQSAFTRLNAPRPATVFSSTDQMAAEIADLATDVAVDIMKSADWRELTKVATLAGDGVTTSFALPADYDRMVQAQDVDDPTNWLWGYSQTDDLSQWVLINSGRFFAITPGWWIILGGRMQFYPAPAASSSAVFPYISDYIGIDQAGQPLKLFSSDTDSFALDERLLTLGLIWRWKAQKGLEYAEDMSNYEIALSQAQTRTGGAKVIRKGWRRLSGDFRPAWPWQLG